MKLKYFRIYNLILLICLTSFGCVSVRYLQRDEYMLNVKMPSKAKRSIPKEVLKMSNVTIVPQFSNLSFVYRISDINYTRDYYHIFFNPPAQQIEQLVIKYLQAKNLFKYIVSDASILPPNYILRSEITALYADYRDFKRPKAVIAIHFTLFNNKTRILMNRTFSGVISLRRKDTRSLVYAWNRGLGKILVRLSGELYKVII